MLEQAVVFVAGLGGLGCLLAELLIRAGIGKIYLCDKGKLDHTGSQSAVVLHPTRYRQPEGQDRPQAPINDSLVFAGDRT